MAKDAAKQPPARSLETATRPQYWIIQKMYEDCLRESEKLHPQYGTAEWRLRQELCEIASLCRAVVMDVSSLVQEHLDDRSVA